MAARQPKGLAAIIPWEGMSDYYRDRCRHGGILSNAFIDFWWNRQVVTNQYGRPGRNARNWGPDTIDGDLSESQLLANRNDQNTDNSDNYFRDDIYYASKEYNMADIVVPMLSVANWGGILLHLRGNVEGYTHAGSEFKYLRFITGRHDLPFYYPEEVEIQKSFLDAFLKGEDAVGWSVKGKLPPVDLVLRKGDVGFNNAEAEKAYLRRHEFEWPIARTKYTPFHLTPDKTLSPKTGYHSVSAQKLTYKAMGTLENPQSIQFSTPPFETETEITGHPSAHLNVSATGYPGQTTPTDIDLFLTLRIISSEGKELYYTGTAGDPVPLTKGWLRVSLRKTNPDHPKAKRAPYMPYRDYFSTDVQPVIPGEVYGVDVEIWPTNVVVEKGSRIVLEVSSGDTQGSGLFLHNSPTDRYVILSVYMFTLLTLISIIFRPESKFQGQIHIWFGPAYSNFLTLPIIPSREE